MRKFLILAALAAPFFVSSIARADDDAKPAKTKKMKKSKKMKKADGTTTTEKTEKTEKPADAPANP